LGRCQPPKSILNKFEREGELAKEKKKHRRKKGGEIFGAQAKLIVKALSEYTVKSKGSKGEETEKVGGGKQCNNVAPTTNEVTTCKVAPPGVPVKKRGILRREKGVKDKKVFPCQHWWPSTNHQRGDASST